MAQSDTSKRAVNERHLHHNNGLLNNLVRSLSALAEIMVVLLQGKSDGCACSATRARLFVASKATEPLVETLDELHILRALMRFVRSIGRDMPGIARVRACMQSHADQRKAPAALLRGLPDRSSERIKEESIFRILC